MNSHRNIEKCIRVYSVDGLLYVVKSYLECNVPKGENTQIPMIFDLNSIVGISGGWRYDRDLAKYDISSHPGFIPVSTIFLSNGCGFTFEGIKYKDLQEIYERFKKLKRMQNDQDSCKTHH